MVISPHIPILIAVIWLKCIVDAYVHHITVQDGAPVRER